MSKQYLKVCIIALSLLLVGCGGSGGSSSASSSTSGVVAGSFYEGARVCFDTTNNASCSDEDYVLSDSNGEFTLTGNSNASIIAEIVQGAKKHEVIGDAGVDINASTTTVFAIPAEAISKAKNSASGKVVLSALSTRLYIYVKDNPNKDIDTAMQEVANILGLDKDELLKNFNDSNMDEKTRIEIKQKADILLDKMKGHTTIDDIKQAVSNVVGAMRLPNKIDIIKTK